VKVGRKGTDYWSLGEKPIKGMTVEVELDIKQVKNFTKVYTS
jgi:hypothetical protein